MTKTILYDVVAVHLKTHLVRLIAEERTERNAEAIIEMAVIRRGVEEEFFARALHGVYKEGDVWRGEEAQPRKSEATASNESGESH